MTEQPPERPQAGSPGLAPGSLVAGYRVERQVGAGRTGAVYQARDERLGQVVALKVLAPGLAADEQFRQWFIWQTRAAAAVRHPHIIPVSEVSVADDRLFVAMRLVNGGDLRSVLHREGALAPERAAGLVAGVASALDAAHAAGLVHGAVRPGNILVEEQPGSPEQAYLADFGLSQVVALASAGGFTLPPGAADYQAPEQGVGQTADGRADQYGLACTAFALLAGRPPFVRDDPRAVLWAHAHEQPPPLSSLRPGVPRAADQVLARALAKAPGDRCPSCGQFAECLRQALVPARYAQAPVRAPAPAPAATAALPSAAAVTAPARRSRRRLAIIAAAAGALLVAAAVVVPVVLLSRPGQPATHKPTAVRIHPALTATLTDPQGSNGVNGLAFSPDGKTLALGDSDGSTYLWDVATRRLAGTLTDQHGGSVDALAFSPDGTILATGDLDGDSTHLWDVATGRLAAILKDPQAGNTANLGITGLAFSQNGETLAVGDDDGSTYLWDAAADRIIATLTDPGSSPSVNAVALSPDGKTLAVGDADDSTYLWDLATHHIVATLTDPGDFAMGVGALAFSPDGKTLAAGDEDGSTYLWNLATHRIVATLADPAGSGSTNNTPSVAFSPDGTTLAAGNEDGDTYLWDVDTHHIVATLAGPVQGSSNTDSSAGPIVFSPNGKMLAVGVAFDLSTYTGDDSADLWTVAEQAERAGRAGS